MLKLDKNFEKFLEENNATKIKIYFYNAGCAGQKVGVDFEDFEITDNLENYFKAGNTEIYTEKSDREKFENAMIVRTARADHTGVEKIRYIYNTESIKRRCGCGTSFSFEGKKVKLDMANLKNLKEKFAKK